MVEDKENNESSEIGPSASDSRSSLEITDLLGIGSAAKSQAAREVVKAFSKFIGVVVDPARVLLLGLAKNKVDANRIVTIAKAEAEARHIQIVADDVIDRMKQRVIATEFRHQLNVEAAVGEAVEILDTKHSSDPAHQIDDDWMANWMIGAQEASAAEVRSYWARVLASQTLNKAVSGPSLVLLRNLDAALAKAFSDFVAFLCVYGCYPIHGPIGPNAISPRTLAILKEIGFITEGMQYSYRFNGFKLRLGGGGGRLPMVHGVYSLTHRSHELMLALFGKNPLSELLEGKMPPETEQVSTYVSVITRAIEEGPHPVNLYFPISDSEHDVVVSFQKPSNTSMSLPWPDILKKISENKYELSAIEAEILRRLNELNCTASVTKKERIKE